MSSASSDSSEERFLAAVSKYAHKRRLSTVSSSDEGNDHFSPSRSSSRLRDKRRHAFTLPTREKVWGSISSNATLKSYRHLKPRKLVTEWIKERNYYNRDRERASDEEASLEDFIDDKSSEDSCEPRKTRLKNKRYKRVISSASSSECDSAIDEPKTTDFRHPDREVLGECHEVNRDRFDHQINASLSNTSPKNSNIDELHDKSPCEDDMSTLEVNKITVCDDPCNAFRNGEKKIGKNSECLILVSSSDQGSDDEDIVKGITPLSRKHCIASDDESSDSITLDMVERNASISDKHCIVSDEESSNSVTSDVVEVNASDFRKGGYIASGKRILISDNKLDGTSSTSTSDSVPSDDTDTRTSRQAKLRRKPAERRRCSMLTELIAARAKKRSRDES